MKLVAEFYGPDNPRFSVLASIICEVKQHAASGSRVLKVCWFAGKRSWSPREAVSHLLRKVWKPCRGADG